jgi:hypothetical protein
MVRPVPKEIRERLDHKVPKAFKERRELPVQLERQVPQDPRGHRGMMVHKVCKGYKDPRGTPEPPDPKVQPELMAHRGPKETKGIRVQLVQKVQRGHKAHRARVQVVEART